MILISAKTSKKYEQNKNFTWLILNNEAKDLIKFQVYNNNFSQIIEQQIFQFLYIPHQRYVWFSTIL